MHFEFEYIIQVVWKLKVIKRMLSRRNVRVKVMQILYTYNRDKIFTKEDAIKEYWARIESSYELLLFSIYNIIQIAKISTEDCDKRKSKHLPTDFDKVFEAKLWENPIIQFLEKNKYLTKEFDKRKFVQKVDKDHFRTIYYEFSKDDIYADFVKNETSDEDILETLLALFRYCRKNELFNEIIEDQYSNWDDDKSIIIGTIKKVLRAVPNEDEKFILTFYPDDETCKDYGEFLLDKVLKYDVEILGYIDLVLENWDADRVAVIDMIMLKMAVSELLYCPTIPTKVTLNEYVELAKTYSTDKSKEFVNGVLDKLVKELTDKKLLIKEGRGLLDS